MCYHCQQRGYIHQECPRRDESKLITWMGVQARDPNCFAMKVEVDGKIGLGPGELRQHTNTRAGWTDGERQ